MDVTPRELRDVEIREAFRGYSRDDVNDLLERAAGTIEALSERVRELGSRLASVESDSGQSRETEELLHRTLLLAKRAADEEVSEAQAKARQLLDDAETRARATLTEAEAEARRHTETQRRRLEDEIAELATRRDVLLGDVETLGAFEEEYRERLRRSIEADLAVISGRTPARPGPPPGVSDIEVPAVTEAVLSRPVEPIEPAEPVERRAPAPVPGGEAAAGEAHAGSASAGPSPADAGTSAGAAAGVVDRAAGPDVAARAVEPAEAAPSSTAAGDAPIDLFGEESVEAVEAVEAEVLDDDAFFATLREAVSDEHPMSDEETTFFDQDVAEASSRDFFKRRR